MTLSDREMQVVSLLCDGFQTKEIASALKLSPCTVKNYLNRIKLKIGVRTTVQLVMQAVKRGLVKL